MTIKDSWEENMKIKKLLPAVLAALLSLTVIMSPLSIHADEDDPKPTSIRRLNYSKKPFGLDKNLNWKPMRVLLTTTMTS